MTLDLDGAIQHCHEKAKELRAEAVSQAHNPECEEYAKEHEQLAEWLEELKEAFVDAYNKYIKVGTE